MKKLISLLFFVSLNLFAQTKAPIQLLNPAGSTAGQVIVSTGATSAPAWGAIAAGYVPTLNQSTTGNAATATTATNQSGGTVSATTVTASSTITRTVPDNISAAIPTIASATTIAPTTPVIFVSGTTAIATITAPTGCTHSCSIKIIPTGVFATTTAGNISIVSTAVVSKALIMTYDATGSKWYPSY